MEGAGDLTVLAGSLVLNGASTAYDGDIIVRSGAVLTGTVAMSFGSAAGTTTAEDGGTVELSPTAITTFPETFSIQGDGAPDECGALVATLNGVGSAANTSGTINLLSDATLCINGNPQSDIWTISGNITGIGDLTWRSNVNTTALITTIGGSGVSSYVGHTYIDAPLGGTLRLNRENAITGDATVTGTGGLQAFGASSTIPDTSVIHLASPNARFSAMSGTETVKYVTGAGRLVIDIAGTQMIFNHDDDVTVDASLVPNIPLAGTFVKRGDGIMTWNGNNTRPNTTYNFESGTVIFNGTMLPANITNVLPGATLKGDGTLGIVNVTGGTIAPGVDSGTLNVASLTLDSDSTFEQEIDGPAAGTEYDVLLANNTVTLGDATLNVTPTYTPDIGHIFTIIEAADAIGTFAGLADGDEFTVDGLTFRINYSATEVTLTFLGGEYIEPEPTPVVIGDLDDSSIVDPQVDSTRDLAKTGISLLAITLVSLAMIAAAVTMLWRMKTTRI